MSLFKSSIVVSAMSIFVSLFSFANQIIIARVFGAGHALDIYLQASSIPLLVSGLLSSALSYSLTPYLLKIKLNQSEEYSSFCGRLFAKVILGSLILFAFVGVVIITNLSTLFPTVAENERLLTIEIHLLSLLTALLSTMFAFFNCMLNAENKFVLPVISGFFPYLLSILIILIGQEVFGVFTISTGLFLGTFLATLILFIKVRHRLSWRANKMASTQSKVFLKTIPVTAMAMLCFTVYQSIDSYWLPRLGSSNLSYFGYCQRLLIAIGTLVITGPSTVLIPHLTKAVAEDRHNDFLSDVSKLIKIIFALASFLAALCIALCQPIVRILFERGAFRHEDTIAMSVIFPYMLVGMVFMVCTVTLFRILFVKNMGATVAMLGIVSTSIYFIGSFFAVKSNHAVGVAFTYILTWLFLFTSSLLFIFKQSPVILFNFKNFQFLLKQTVLIVAAYLVASLTKTLLSARIGAGQLTEMLNLVISAATASATFLAGIFVIRHEDLKSFMLHFKNR